MGFEEIAETSIFPCLHPHLHMDPSYGASPGIVILNNFYSSPLGFTLPHFSGHSKKTKNNSSLNQSEDKILKMRYMYSVSQ